MKIGDKVSYNGHTGILLNQCGSTWLIELDKPISGISVIAVPANCITLAGVKLRNSAIGYTITWMEDDLTFSRNGLHVHLPCSYSLFCSLKEVIGRNWHETT